MPKFPYTATFNRVRRTIESQERYLSHVRFLDQCERSNHIPKGFLLKWRNNLQTDPIVIPSTAEILQATSKRLMHDCVQIINGKIVEIQIYLLVEMTRLEAELSEEENRNVIEYLTNFRTKQ